MGRPTAVCAKVVDKDIGAMTAPVEGSRGEPAWTARVPNPCTGEGALAGVSIQPSSFVRIRSWGSRGREATVIVAVVMMIETPGLGQSLRECI
jgi:hypothetical protein